MTFQTAHAAVAALMDSQDVERDLVDIAGDVHSDYNVNFAVREIGNPDAEFPVASTSETVADYVAHGWEVVATGEITELRRRGATVTTGRRPRTPTAYAYVADCGDHRLVHVVAF